MRSFLIGSACTALIACTSAQRIDLCRRGDRVDVTSFRLTSLDQAGALLDEWNADADHESSTTGPIAKGTRRVHVEGVDATGTTVAVGEAAVTNSDSICVCVASTAQQQVACENVSCHVANDHCVFTDDAGAPPGVQTLTFGDNTGDDVRGVTADTYLDGTPADQDKNLGGELLVKIRADPTEPRPGLWRFNLGAIPSTAQIMSATLGLTTGLNATENAVDFYEVLEDWESGTGMEVIGCSNWTCRSLQGGMQLWTTPGAFDPGSSTSTPLMSMSPPLANTHYDVSAEPLRALVQRWVQTPSSNHGITGRMAPSTSSVEYVSAEGTDGMRPELRLELVIPPEQP